MDTLAVGKYERIDKNLLRVSSDDHFYAVVSGTIRIIRQRTSDLDSTVIVKVNTPKLECPYTLSISYNDVIYHYLESADSEFKIPVTNIDRVKELSIVIYPKQEYLRTLDVNGEFRGLLFFPVKIEEELSANRLEISIPELTEDYFNRAYFNGEYVCMRGNKLYWRGSEYKLE